MTYTQARTCPKSLANEKVVISLKRAAVILECNEESLRRQCVSGTVPAVKINGRWCFYKDTFERYLAGDKNFSQSQLDRVEKKLDILLEKIGV